MKVTVHYGGINEVVQAKDAEDALSRFKAEVAKRAPLLMRPVVKAMNDLTFASEAVSRANKQSGRQDPTPKTAREFLDWAVARGYITVEE